VATSRIAELVGRVLGDRYRLTRPIGAGASANVYVADDVRLHRRVAVKVLHPALAGDEAFGRRFRAEAQVVASLQHPNILRVLDWGDEGGTPYLVMELLEGGSLRSLLDRGQLLSPSQAAAVGADVARALDHAHRRGLVHRDIKPANLIFDEDGRVTVADFGLARALAEASWTEPAGAVVGTARYAAPEQARGEALDGRADVYSLALVLVEAASGTVPFASDTTIGTLMGRAARPLEAPDSLGPLRQVLELAGTVQADDRLDAGSLAAALDRAARKLPPPAALPLAGSGLDGEVELDDYPTEIPGGAQLFDGEEGTRPARREEATEHPPPVATKRRRRWLRRSALGLAVALLAAGGVAGYQMATGPPPWRVVPGLAGDTRAAAAGSLAPLHLQLSVASRSYDATAKAGTIIAQDVPPGTRLREGAAVGVTLSLGPQPIPVPSLAGQSQQDAQSVLATLGLTAGPVTTASSLAAPQGQVISSSPSSGTLLPGQAVSLLVSSGKPLVGLPALTAAQSASFGAAQAALAAVSPGGLSAVESDDYSNSVPKGQVIRTDPPPGTQVRAGTTVTVVISKGPHYVTVPYLAVGTSVNAATQTLTARGLNVSGVMGNPTAAVTGTLPGEGSVVLIGSSVQILTG
jgi:serine/threonine-protein kinase